MKEIEKFMKYLVNKYNIKISKRQTLENLSAIYVGEKTETLAKRFLAEKLALLSVILCVGFILTILTMFGTEKKTIQKNTVNRPIKGEVTKEVNANVEVDNSVFPITFSLDEVRMQNQELDQMFEQLAMDLPRLILKGNKELSNVQSSLNLIDRIDESNITVKWESNSPSIVDYQGNVNNANVSENGELVTLTAKLDYYGKKAETSFEVIVKPPTLTNEEIMINSILEEINLIDNKNIYESNIMLPTKIGDKPLKWSVKSQNLSLKIFAFTIIFMAVIFKIKDYELEEKVKKRKQQMLVDYSEIVAKLSLLISAGLTTGAAIQKVAADYSKTKKNKIRYAFEELLICCSSLNNGKTEQEVLEYYGLRCGMPEYLRLTSILSQNLKKGTAELAITLDELTIDAFQQKKAIAKILGEKASTKLLLPMMLLLIIVLLIVVVPTFISIKF
jgi:Flp pilus assembly protein TadB